MHEAQVLADLEHDYDAAFLRYMDAIASLLVAFADNYNLWNSGKTTWPEPDHVCKARVKKVKKCVKDKAEGDESNSTIQFLKEHIQQLEERSAEIELLSDVSKQDMLDAINEKVLVCLGEITQTNTKL